MKVSSNAPCPCGTERKLKRCCGVFHGGRPADPETLMRARYTAYATGNVAFVMDTTHPEGPHAQPDRARWKAELAQYCAQILFEGLEVLAREVDTEQGRATVTFRARARLRRDGREVSFTERSLFVREGRRWRYHSGEMLE